MKASTPTTSWPSAISRSARCEPMKPAAPVTRHRIAHPSLLASFPRFPRRLSLHARLRGGSGHVVAELERVQPGIGAARAQQLGMRSRLDDLALAQHEDARSEEHTSELQSPVHLV